MVSCGNREIIRYLLQHNRVSCVVTTGGGIEEDIIKCFAPFQKGSFNEDDKELRMRQINRIGNILVPSKNYGLFEDWLIPLFHEMYEE